MKEKTIYFAAMLLLCLAFTTQAVDPIGHWKLDETSGVTVQDATTNDNDGFAWGSPDLTPTGIDGTGVNLDGVDDYIEIGNADFFDMTNQLTLSCWVKVDSWSVNPATYEGVFAKWPSYALRRNGGNNSLEFYCHGIGTAAGDNDVADGEWHHIVCVYDVNDGDPTDPNAMYLYVDGEVDGINATVVDNMIASADYLKIGHPYAGNFSGVLVDDARIYDVALDADQVVEIYREMIPLSVNAGSNQHANLQSGQAIVNLDATIGSLAPYSSTWTNETSGVGTVIFGNDSDEDTTATFTTAGTYTLRLTGNPGAVYDEIVVKIDPEGYLGLIGHWKLDGNANDSTTYANNGTLEGDPNFSITGQIDTAVDCNGVSDAIVISDDTHFDRVNVLNEVTLSCWIKVDSWTAGYEGIFGRWPSFAIRRNGENNSVEFYCHTINGAFGTSSVADGQWHHVAGTYNGSVLHLFVDGVQDASMFALGDLAEVDAELTIGRLYAGSNSGVSVDDARIYEYALAADDVAIIYDEGRTGCVGGPLKSDLNEDCTVDLGDFVLMAGQWLQTNQIKINYF